MKQRISRILAAVMTAMMLVAMAIPTAAATGTGSLTISGAREGEEYRLFRILDVSYDPQSGNMSYLKNAKYEEYFNSKVRTVTAQQIVTRKLGNQVLSGETPTGDDIYAYISNDVDTVAFAMGIGQWIESNNIQADATVPVGEVDADPESSSPQTAVAGELPYGYYLLMPTEAMGAGSSGSVLFSLDTLTDNAQIVSKTAYPVPDKTVNGEKTNSAGTGDEMEFEVKTVLPDLSAFASGNGNYTFTIADTMEALTYVQNSAAVTLTQGESAQTLTVQPSWNAAAKTLNVEVGPQLLALVKDGLAQDPRVYYTGAELKLTYRATLDSLAAINHYADNSAVIRYTKAPGSSSTTQSKEDRTRTYTMNLRLNVKNGKNQDLKGTKWTLEKYDSSADEHWIDVSESSLSSGNAASFDITGLALGEYCLTEKESPDGYHPIEMPIFFNLVADPLPDKADNTTLHPANLRIEIEDDMEGRVMEGSHIEADSTYVLNLRNTTHDELPSTGGAGLFVIFIIGIAALAAFFILGRIRRDAEE